MSKEVTKIEEEYLKKLKKRIERFDRMIRPETFGEAEEFQNILEKEIQWLEENRNRVQKDLKNVTNKHK